VPITSEPVYDPYSGLREVNPGDWHLFRQLHAELPTYRSFIFRQNRRVTDPVLLQAFNLGAAGLFENR